MALDAGFVAASLLRHPDVDTDRRSLVNLQKLCLKRASRKPPSLAVARNYGIGSRSLNADVNAFDTLQTVRGLNSSYCGSFPSIWRRGGEL
jgi:hypothetical protein